MDELEEEFNEGPGEQSENKQEGRADHLKPWQYKKGQSGNPSGRPEGISLKEYARKNFRHMTDEEREKFLEGIDKKTIWEMSEGKPKQDMELSGGLTISQVLDDLENDERSTP